MGMNVMYRMWWRALMDTRPLFRYLAERFPKAAPWAIRARTAAHICVGHPTPAVLTVLVLVAWRAGLPFRPVVAVAVAVWLVVEAVHRWRFESGGDGWFVGWREAWRVHRRMPSLWADGAAKTTAVQAEVGTSKEPVASAKLRPIADHPKMGWWPTIECPQVSWWVGPPPGRTFDQFEAVLTVLATNYSRCIGMELDYQRATDSYARLTVSFGSVLDKTIEPETTEVDAKPWTPTVETEDSPTNVCDLHPKTDISEDETDEDEGREAS